MRTKSEVQIITFPKRDMFQHSVLCLSDEKYIYKSACATLSVGFSNIRHIYQASEVLLLVENHI